MMKVSGQDHEDAGDKLVDTDDILHQLPGTIEEQRGTKRVQVLWDAVVSVIAEDTRVNRCDRTGKGVKSVASPRRGVNN